MKINIFNEKLRILVTGGAGFIGSCFIRRILKETNSLIFNLDKLSYASDIIGVEEFQKNKKYFLLQADLSNYEETEKALKKADPDLIIHLAAESHVDRSIESPLSFIDSNVRGTANVLELAKKHNH